MRELSMMIYFTEFTRRMLVPLKKLMFHILPHPLLMHQADPTNLPSMLLDYQEEVRN
jgi:hypothetical protein